LKATFLQGIKIASYSGRVSHARLDAANPEKYLYIMRDSIGILLNVGRDERPSRYHYYVSLPDLLMDIVERDSTAPQAERIAELAHSFAHDVLKLAVLASRLLWYEALTPDMDRSPDLVAVSTDAESYFLFLKAACDLLAEITVEVAVDAGRRGQVPSGSFNDLARWVRDNPTRIDPRFHFLAQESQWFDELHGIRTNLAHRGYDTLIYTDRVYFSFGTAPFGRAETRILRENRGEPADSRRIALSPLLPFVKRLTQSMLRASDQLVAAAVSHLSLEPPSTTHALCGVYVPALHSLDSYEPPVESPRLQIIVDCLHQCEDYHMAAKFGFSEGYWWQFLIALSERFAACPVYIGPFTEGPPDVLVDWKIIFAADGKKLGIVGRDMIATDKTWLQGAQGNLEKFVGEAQLERAALVTRLAWIVH
jgi:hypothetical protein